MSDVACLNVIDVDTESQVWLGCDVRAADAGGVTGWAGQVDEQLRWGSAAPVMLGSAGPLDTAVAVVVGAWTSDNPCCDVDGPEPDELCSAEGTLRIEACVGCGVTIVPDVWAVLPIAQAGFELWLPDPADVAHHADWSLRRWLRRYRAQARREALTAVEPHTTDDGVELLTAPGEADTLLAAQLRWKGSGGRQMFHTTLKTDPDRPGRLQVGWCEPAPAKGPQRWEPRFGHAIELAAQPAALVGLMDAGSRDELLNAASADGLDARMLQTAWERLVDEPASWVCDDEAVQDITAKVHSAHRNTHARQRTTREGISR